MAASAPIRSRRAPRPHAPAETRFDRRLSHILAHATAVFDERGYEGASMRDLSRATGMSLAGLYYYFESKEKLLYLIQRHTFKTILGRLEQRLQAVSDPEERIRVFIHNHLDYFLEHQQAMKVLSHEDEVLKNGYGAEIAAMKRDYVRTCVELLEQFKRARKLDFPSRTAALSLFGMMNWIYTWYNPRKDPGADALAREMAGIFLRGITARRNGK